MKPVSFAELAAWSGGELVHGQPERMVTRVTTDSRAILPGDLFVALIGDKFDGHQFVAEAFRQGALAVMVSGEIPADAAPSGAGVIRVGDTLKGLQELSRAYRSRLPVRVVAITGSNGKTSTKEFLAGVLSKLGPTAKTQGNLNNHIGVPLTLLSLDESHLWAVVEMGMNHSGELRPLVELARPEIGVITQAGWAHIENFPDRDAIASEKGEVAYHLSPGGFAVLQGDNPRLRALAGRIRVPVAWVGSGEGNEFRILTKAVTEQGSRFEVSAGGKSSVFTIPVPGLHMIENAALAVAVGWKLGLDAAGIAEGLNGAVLPKGRLALKPRGEGWLLDDTYNANPDSMAAAFRTLMSMPGQGRGVALLGSMGELGTQARELHHWVGTDAAAAGITCLHAVGPNAGDLVEGARAGGIPETGCWPDHESLAKGYLQKSRRNDRIVVKGSHSAAMEKVLPLLEN